MTLWDKIQYEFNKGNSPVRKLIIINIAIFVLSGLVSMVGRGVGKAAQAEQFLSLFYTPAAFADFILKPWSVITYMFFHGGIFHIVGNLLLLYYLGRILLDFQSNKKFYTLFFLGGIFGAFMYMTVFAVLPGFAGEGFPMLGASGGVMAVVVAAAVLLPTYELFLFGAFRIQLKWIAIVLVAKDVLYLTTSNQGGHLAHIGGAIVGALFILHQQGRLNLDLLKAIKNPFKPRFSVIDERDILRGNKQKVKTEAHSAPRHAAAGSAGKPRQEEIDAILDKINQSGYPSLTQEEKDLLFRASDK